MAISLALMMVVGAILAFVFDEDHSYVVRHYYRSEDCGGSILASEAVEHASCFNLPTREPRMNGTTFSLPMEAQVFLSGIGRTSLIESGDEELIFLCSFPNIASCEEVATTPGCPPGDQIELLRRTVSVNEDAVPESSSECRPLSAFLDYEVETEVLRIGALRFPILGYLFETVGDLYVMHELVSGLPDVVARVLSPNEGQGQAGWVEIIHDDVFVDTVELEASRRPEHILAPPIRVQTFFVTNQCVEWIGAAKTAYEYAYIRYCDEFVILDALYGSLALCEDDQISPNGWAWLNAEDEEIVGSGFEYAVVSIAKFNESKKCHLGSEDMFQRVLDEISPTTETEKTFMSPSYEFRFAFDEECAFPAVRYINREGFCHHVTFPAGHRWLAFASWLPDSDGSWKTLNLVVLRDDNVLAALYPLEDINCEGSVVAFRYTNYSLLSSCARGWLGPTYDADVHIQFETHLRPPIGLLDEPLMTTLLRSSDLCPIQISPEEWRLRHAEILDQSSTLHFSYPSGQCYNAQSLGPQVVQQDLVVAGWSFRVSCTDEGHLSFMKYTNEQCALGYETTVFETPLCFHYSDRPAILSCFPRTCFGVLAESDDTCSAHGVCVARDACECAGYFTGKNCEIAPAWYRRNASLLTVCFSLGFVVAVGLYFRQRMKAGRMYDLLGEEINILMVEKETERGVTLPRFKIDQKLFGIEFSSLKVIRSLSPSGLSGSGASLLLVEFEGIECVFKSFSVSVFAKESATREFERELQVLSSLRHPNLAVFIGVVLTPPRIGVVLEYCPHGDLQDYLTAARDRGGVVSLERKIEILRQISLGMSYLHFRTVINRDLKARNILVDAAENCRLTDFGLSRVVDAEKSASLTVGIGTRRYMSPEMILGLTYTEKTDVFSFGILAYEVLSLDFNPYSGVEYVEMKVSSSPTFRPDLKKLPPEIPAVLVNLVESCWDHLPANRPSFVTILSQLQGGLVHQSNDDSDVGEKLIVYLKLAGESDEVAEDFLLPDGSLRSLRAAVEAKWPIKSGSCSYSTSTEGIGELSSDEAMRKVQDDDVIAVSFGSPDLQKEA